MQANDPPVADPYRFRMNDELLEVRPAGAKGLGGFAVRPIPAGTRVIQIAGWVLPSDQLTDDLLALQIGPDLWLCSDGSSLDDRINHSCDPNLGFLHGDPVLYALRDIAAGEEVAWDYSTSLAEPGWSLDCACRSPSCRRVVRSWGELSPADRDRLRPVALAYLRG
jgi:SET domain-containing protein